MCLDAVGGGLVVNPQCHVAKDLADEDVLNFFFFITNDAGKVKLKRFSVASFFTILQCHRVRLATLSYKDWIKLFSCSSSLKGTYQGQTLELTLLPQQRQRIF